MVKGLVVKKADRQKCNCGPSFKFFLIVYICDIYLCVIMHTTSDPCLCLSDSGWQGHPGHPTIHPPTPIPAFLGAWDQACAGACPMTLF